MDTPTCHEFDSYRLHIYLSLSSVHADDIMNGYFGSLTFNVALPTELLNQPTELLSRVIK